MSSNQKDIKDLRLYYKNLTWYQRWFFPSQLANALEKKPSNSSEICRIFHETSYWSYLFSGIRQFSYSKIYSNYLNYFIHRPSQKCWNQFLELIDAEELLNSGKAQTCFDKIVRHPQPDELYPVLLHLKGTGFFTREWREKNLSTLVAHESLIKRTPCGLESVFLKLSKTELLSNSQAQANFDAIMQRTYIGGGDLDSALISTNTSIALFQGEHAQALFELVVKHENPARVTSILTSIHNLGINIKQFFPFFQKKQHRLWDEEINFILAILYKNNLLQETIQLENVWAVLHYKWPYELAKILPLLMKNNLLNHGPRLVNVTVQTQNGPYRLPVPVLAKQPNQESGLFNLKIAMQHKNSGVLVKTLKELDTQGLLTQETFYINYFGIKENIEHKNILMILNEAKLLTPQYIQHVLTALDPYRCRHTIWNIETITEVMNTSGLLNLSFGYKNFMTVTEKKSGFLFQFLSILKIVNQVGLLATENGQDNFNALLQVECEHAQQIFEILARLNLLNQQNFTQILAHTHRQNLLTLIDFFNTTDLLTNNEAQVTLGLIISNTDSLQFLTRDIPSWALTAHWPHLAQILHRQLDPEVLNQTLRNYVNNFIFRIRPNTANNRGRNRANNAAEFENTAQSTHTASVHITTDLTAWLLLEKNASNATAEIDLNTIWLSIQEKLKQERTAVKQEIEALQSNLELSAAEQTQQLKVAQVKWDLLEV
ncbi:MAG: hypothetical protein H0U73_04340 [Tatlockia sp.]|nr:hypothetical protein [Tatlockia sp.]